MAKYYGSSWGYIKGKLGDAIGSITKGGVKTVRAYRKGKSPGSYRWLLHNKPYPKAIRQANIKHVVFPLILSIAHQKSRDLILPVWKPLTKYKPKLTHFNLFVKANFQRLYRSIPNPFEFCSNHNSPDLCKLILTYGDLEPARITKIKWQNQRTLQVNWDTKCFRNGNPDDNAYIMAIQYQLPDFLGGKCICKIWGDALHPLAKREDGQASLYIYKHQNLLTYTPQQLKLFKLNEPNKLTIYLFFSNPKIGYSISTPFLCMDFWG